MTGWSNIKASEINPRGRRHAGRMPPRWRGPVPHRTRRPRMGGPVLKGRCGNPKGRFRKGWSGNLRATDRRGQQSDAYRGAPARRRGRGVDPKGGGARSCWRCDAAAVVPRTRHPAAPWLAGAAGFDPDTRRRRSRRQWRPLPMRPPMARSPPGGWLRSMSGRSVGSGLCDEAISTDRALRSWSGRIEANGILACVRK